METQSSNSQSAFTAIMNSTYGQTCTQLAILLHTTSALLQRESDQMIDTSTINALIKWQEEVVMMAAQSLGVDNAKLMAACDDIFRYAEVISSSEKSGGGHVSQPSTLLTERLPRAG